MGWSIKGLLQPVMARALIYGVNPIDLEYVIAQVQDTPLINGAALSNAWLNQWEIKINHFLALADEAEEKKNRLSVKQYLWYATQCYYASFLINCDKVAEKKSIYEKFVACYKRYITYDNDRVEAVEIPLEDGQSLPGYLHLPKEPAVGPYPCVIIFGGLGSAKEEFHTQAMPLVERGIAVLACDIPGMGQALFERGMICNGYAIDRASKAMINWLKGRKEIDANALGTCGLCMGGGYAYHAATLDPGIKSCVNLFPLFVTQIQLDRIPRWMQVGTWANFQQGSEGVEAFLENMKILESGTLNAAYLFVHGQHDNWMTIDAALKLYEAAKGYKEKLIIEEEPVYSVKNAITHTMPVGEQMHWLKYVIADWQKAQLLK